VVSFKLQLVYPHGKGPHYPLNEQLGGPSSQFGIFREEKNFLSPLGIIVHTLVFELSWASTHLMLVVTYVLVISRRCDHDVVIYVSATATAVLLLCS